LRKQSPSFVVHRLEQADARVLTIAKWDLQRRMFSEMYAILHLAEQPQTVLHIGTATKLGGKALLIRAAVIAAGPSRLQMLGSGPIDVRGAI
jgi:hypothetical protein